MTTLNNGSEPNEKITSCRESEPSIGITFIDDERAILGDYVIIKE